jgi:predicted nucleic acid-binding protein
VTVFFDTSVLVATALLQHPQHQPSLLAYAHARKTDSFCGAHSLAELYATLTRLPGSQRLSCEDASLFIQDVRKRLSVITLSQEDYLETISSLVAAHISGAAVYDALLARCALKSGAEVLYTWNVDDFRRLSSEIAKKVQSP